MVVAFQVEANVIDDELLAQTLLEEVSVCLTRISLLVLNET